ncbi:sensor histidine kinase [Chitinophaga nivalis]|uniref:Histidine kinase n=1 Tax=Chitinophaga nivalis TaxID=2991709 RepID=A0ABT3ILF7_9BACT|nr:histidine kinase [Chitinophaga nivalis]MCW3465541.1 histidine kinase [Chitinophaga nivalis]MCW3484768.1 histidine kinase [Chitinophaga nivalis]
MYSYLYAAMLLLCLWLPSTAGSTAQELPAVHYTTENGLPANMVYCVYRDHKGFLWFGTDKGLVMYNGIRFETLTTFDGAPDNEILAIREDGLHRLWIHTYKGGLCYYQHRTFHTTENTPFLRAIDTGTPIGVLNAEPDSSVTIINRDQLEFISIKEQRSRRYQLADIRKKTSAGYLLHIRKITPALFQLQMTDMDIIMDTAAHILQVKPFSGASRVKPLFSQDQTYMVLNNAIVTPQQALVHTIRPGTFTAAGISACYRTGSDLLLATFDQGLFINQQPPVFTNCRISGITQDIAGNFWITTLNNGIYYISQSAVHNNVRQPGYTGQIKYAAADAGTLYFTTDNNNLYRYRQQQLSCIFSYTKNGNAATKMSQEPGITLKRGSYHSFYNEDHVIIENVHAPILRVQLNKISKSPDRDIKYEGTGIKSVINNSDGIYLLQSGVRIFRIAARSWQASPVTVFETLPVNGNAQRIYNMASDSAGHIWFNTSDTVYKIVGNTNIPQPQFKGISFKRFYIFGNCLVGITHNNKLVICQDLAGNGHVYTLPEQNCIWNRIYKLDARHLLLSTNNLCRLLTLQPAHPQQPYVLTAVENPFIPAQAAYICADSLSCYFFNEGKITTIPKARIFAPPPPPDVFFTHINVNGRLLPVTTGHISVPYRDAGNITLFFSALSFYSRHIRYEYSISGNGAQHWQTATSEAINLLMPGYGEHVVKIRARTLSGGYCQPVLLLLTVERPFWAQPWFVVLLLVAALALLLLLLHVIMQYFMRRRELAHATEIRFMKSEYKALTALMNPHFVFNSLNNIQGLINNEDKRLANEYLRVFADLIRQNMHNIAKGLIPLQKEIDLLHNYLKLEKLRFGDALNYLIEVDTKLDTLFISVPPLLVQPLVENAIKHGLLPKQSPDSLVHIRMYLQGTLLHIAVQDNGVGIHHARPNPSPLHESFALENIRQRIEQLKRIHNMHIALRITAIEDENDTPQGTIALLEVETGKL